MPAKCTDMKTASLCGHHRGPEAARDMNTVDVLCNAREISQTGYEKLVLRITENREGTEVTSPFANLIKTATFLPDLTTRITAGPNRPTKEPPMSDSKKCGNPACNCIPPEKEKFCSPHCEGMKQKTEILCGCGHANCAGASPITKDPPAYSAQN
jgi:hypothetical protein